MDRTRTLQKAPESHVNAVGYGRVSTDDQEANTSLETQRKAIKQWCASHSLVLIGFCYDTESGSDVDREGLEQALKLLGTEADQLISLRVDRLSRNAKDLLTLLDWARENEKRIRFCELDIDEREPSGRMIIAITGATAQYELDMIHKRTDEGRKAKQLVFGYAAGAPAFGMRPTSEKELELDAAEQMVIRIVENLRRKGWTYRDIAAKLERDQVPTKRGGKWRHSTVHKICERLESVKKQKLGPGLSAPKMIKSSKVTKPKPMGAKNNDTTRKVNEVYKKKTVKPKKASPNKKNGSP